MATYNITNFIVGGVDAVGVPTTQQNTCRSRQDLVPTSVTLPDGITLDVSWYNAIGGFGTSTFLNQVKAVSTPYTLPIVDGAVAVLLVANVLGESANLNNLNSNSTYELGEAPTETATVSISGATSIELGQSITYTFTLDNAMSVDVDLTVTVDGTDRNVTIPASSLSATTSYTPAFANSVLTSIKSTGNENVTIGTGSVTTQVNAEPQENYVSVQSGNWEDSSTWSNGIIPPTNVNVTISDGHKVFITSNRTHTGTIKVGDTDNTTALTIGNIDTRERAELTLNGATVSGIGRFGVQYGYLRGGSNWSTVSTRYVLNEVSGSFAWAGWDLEKITFDGCELVRINTSHSISGISENPSWTFNNIVFKDCPDVQITQTGQRLPSNLANISFTNSSFVNGKVTFGCQYITSVSLDKCYSSSVLFQHASASTVQYNYSNSSGINTNFNSWDYVDMENCYYATTGGNEARAVGLTADHGSFNRIIAYCSPNGYNSRTVQQEYLSNSFVEDWSTGGGNPIVGGFAGSTESIWTNNILIGTGDGFTSVLGENIATGVTTFNLTCSNNTMVADKCFANNERYTPSSSSQIKYYNNLFVSSATNPYFIFDQNGMVGPTPLDSDYNFANTNQWQTSKYVNSTGTHNQTIEASYPNFIDATRNHEKYATTILGGTDYNDVFTYMQGVNGYNSTTGRNTGTIVPNIVSNMLDWFQEGYTPQNMSLATAGQDGTFVGAIMPNGSPVEKSVVSLSVDKSTIMIGETVTYTLTLDNARQESNTITLTIDGDVRQVVIPANQRLATTSYTPATTGVKMSTITNTGNEDITIGQQSAAVTVNAEAAKEIFLTADTKVVLLDNTYTYALNITNSVEEAFNAVVTVDGVDNTIAIPANSTRVTFNHTASELGTITANIKSITSEDVTIIGGNVVVTVVDQFPTVSVPTSRWELYRYLFKNKLLRQYHQFGDTIFNTYIGTFNE